MTDLEHALFPTVALELAQVVRRANGTIFAGVGDVVLARGNERGTFTDVTLTHPRADKPLGCTLDDIAGARVLDAIPL